MADPDTMVSRDTELTPNQLLFLGLALTFNCKLRELEKILAQIEAVESNFGDLEFDIFWGAYLVFLKDASPDLFAQVIHGDYVHAVQVIKEKFPCKKLYFMRLIIPIHDIFSSYIEMFRGGERKAVERFNRATGIGPICYRIATANFGQKFREMASYPDFVNLAHSLE